MVIGLGEVGLPLFEILKECGKFDVCGYDLDKSRMQDVVKLADLPGNLDIIHICIPCHDKKEFVKNVAGYVERFKPKLVIINSTVEPGTTLDAYRKVKGECLMAHSPVRGVHKSLEHMKWELKRWTKYIGGIDKESAEAARNHFEKAGFRTKVLKSYRETELAKLFETTYRAWMIACFQEMHRISRRLGADFDAVVDFLEDTHRVRLDRPVMFPGVIGGHCLIPNVELLLKSYDSEFLRLILKSNEKREVEIMDGGIREDVEKVRRRVERLEAELIKQR